MFIRAPWVESVGTASDGAGRDRCPVPPAAGPRVRTSGARGDRIVAVRSGSLLATSFHPELTGDHRVHALFAEIVRGAA